MKTEILYEDDNLIVMTYANTIRIVKRHRGGCDQILLTADDMKNIVKAWHEHG